MNSIISLCVFALFSVVCAQEMSGNMLGESIPAAASMRVQDIPNIRTNDNNNNGQQQQPAIIIEKVENRPNPVQTLVLNRPVVNHQQRPIVDIVVERPNVPVVHTSPNTIPVTVSNHRPCHVFSGIGHCVSIPNFFGCIRETAALFPDVDECPFSQACCIPIGQFSPFGSSSS